MIFNLLLSSSSGFLFGMSVLVLLVYGIYRGIQAVKLRRATRRELDRETK